jgi:S1-C subfamily serine protease
MCCHCGYNNCCRYYQQLAKINNDDGIKIYKLKNATCSITSIYSFFTSIGSGFFIKKNNKYFIITCAHLVEDNPHKIYIDVQNVNNVQGEHRQIRCKLIGMDRASDIAVLCPVSLKESPKDGFDITDQPFLNFGDSTSTKIGEKCYIIGNASGLDPFSIVDGLVRDNKFVLDLATESILISAPISPGTSGSPILNKCGQVIGMIGYSIRDIDSNFPGLVGGSTQFMMEKIINIIIENNSDYTTKGFIGIIYFTTISDYILATLRFMFPNFLDGNYDVLKGIVILSLTNPATNATIPLQNLDIITKIKDLKTNEELCVGNLDGQYHPSRMSWFKKEGDKVELTVTRPSTNTTFTTIITLEKYPSIFDFLFSGALSTTISENDGSNITYTTVKIISGKKYGLSTLGVHINNN